MPNLMTLLPFLIILLLFVPLFLNGRKQKRQMAETQSMQQALDTGDVVIMTSGLRGTITDASYEDTIDVEIADGVVTTWLRAAVREKVNPHAGDHAESQDTEVETSSAAATSEKSAENGSATVKPATENKPIIH